MWPSFFCWKSNLAACINDEHEAKQSGSFIQRWPSKRPCGCIFCWWPGLCNLLEHSFTCWTDILVRTSQWTINNFLLFFEIELNNGWIFATRGKYFLSHYRGVHAHSSGQDGGKFEDLYWNSKPANSSWIHKFAGFFLKRVTYVFKETIH